MNSMSFHQLNMNNSAVKKDVLSLLEGQGLQLDRYVSHVYGIYDHKQLIGTGSIAGNTLRSIAVHQEHQGGAVINRLITGLVNEQYQRGITHLFLFAKYESHSSFEHLGFYKVAEVDQQLVLMENKDDGLKRYQKALGKSKHSGSKIASIVINGNPFTLGHQKLIEVGAKENDWLHIFVVWEDSSVFPNEVRYKLVCEGTAHLNNVSIHKGQDYIISNATFPTYFLKDFDEQVRAHAKLDLTLFGESIAPVLKINRRYVGEENYCEVTRFYNETMKKILPTWGIEVIEMKRRKNEDEIISASKVRHSLGEDEWEKIQKVVPASTYEYLLSKEAQPIIQEIKKKKSRH